MDVKSHKKSWGYWVRTGGIRSLWASLHTFLQVAHGRNCVEGTTELHGTILVKFWASRKCESINGLLLALY